jgi:hypothetical protein
MNKGEEGNEMEFTVADSINQPWIFWMSKYAAVGH